MNREKKKRVLLLCTGNACRSQMAEGVVRKYLGDQIDVYSAGIHPSGVHPKAKMVLEELGIDTSPLYSKHVSDLDHIRFDLVITLCNSARQECPFFPNADETVHMPFRDPIFATGTENQILSEFRNVRDEIRDKLIPYLQEYFELQQDH